MMINEKDTIDLAIFYDKGYNAGHQQGYLEAVKHIEHMLQVFKTLNEIREGIADESPLNQPQR
jgi:flagellar biosynthesis/type III secretory pathway protein FliH